MTNHKRDMDKHIQLRPAVPTDLPEHDRRGDEMVSVTMSKIPFSFYTEVGALLAKMETAGYVVDRGYSGSVNMYALPTQEALDTKIRDAAEDWDLAGDQYDTILVDNAEPGEWSVKNRVTTYARKMGLDLPWVTA